MKYRELAKLDREIKDAYTKLVTLNTQYNDLLTDIYNKANGVSTSFVSEREKKLRKGRKIFRWAYCIIFISNMLVYAFLGLPEKIYWAILLSDIGVYQISSIVFAFKIAKERTKDDSLQSNSNNNKDELYEELWKARRLYHSLIKKRDEISANIDVQAYQDYLEHVDKIIETVDANNVENKQDIVKTLSLEAYK